MLKVFILAMFLLLEVLVSGVFLLKVVLSKLLVILEILLPIVLMILMLSSTGGYTCNYLKIWKLRVLNLRSE